ncbi:MAG: rRNA maturation RNase YbeY [Deltaproteobacteria bacterium]|jgi:probable rRNA maturation factor|nr:rRNA maturation RNase YbeY [Deltaproteobacteria bacterium]
MGILITNNQSVWPIRPLSIKRRLNKVLKALNQAEADFTALITDDQSILALNLEFRGLNKATNVLAFPNGQPFPREKGRYLGDVALSMETVQREALAADRPLGEVFYFYLIHGLLHLLGYDHALGPKEEAAQEAQEKRLLALIPHEL